MKKKFLLIIIIIIINFLIINIFNININCKKYKKNTINNNINNFLEKKEKSYNVFNKIDNKTYFIIWKGNKNDNWLVTKFKNKRNFNENIILSIIKDYKLNLFRNVLYISKKNKNNFEFQWLTDKNNNNFKSVYCLNLKNENKNETNRENINIPIINSKNGEIIKK